MLGVNELQERDADALGVEVHRVGGRAARGRAAHVLVVRHRAAVRDEGVPVEDGRDHGHVGQVRAAVVGVVQDVRVAGLRHTLVIVAGDALDRGGEHAEMGGQGLRLGDRLAVPVEDRGGRVERFLHQRGVGALEEHHLHLVGDRREAAAEHLQGHRIERCAVAGLLAPGVSRAPAAAGTSTTRFPSESTTARCPG